MPNTDSTGRPPRSRLTHPTRLPHFGIPTAESTLPSSHRNCYKPARIGEANSWATVSNGTDLGEP